MNNSPLVSVIVVSYNSSSTIIETLESIKNQTYKNIELILADDKSTDNTVAIFKEWMVSNKYRFVDCVIVESEFNTGTAANCNRGIKVSHGEWIRLIAGDDLIPPSAISNQIMFVQENSDIKVLNGYCTQFKYENGTRIELPFTKKIDTCPQFYQGSAADQYHYLLRHYNFGVTDGTLVHKTVYCDVTLYDEKYTIIEDLPFWLNVTKAGVKYYYVDTPTMEYRVHQSVLHAPNENIANQRYLRTKKEIINDMIKPNIPLHEFSVRKNILLDELIYWFIFSVFSNKKTFWSKITLAALNIIKS